MQGGGRGGGRGDGGGLGSGGGNDGEGGAMGGSGGDGSGRKARPIAYTSDSQPNRMSSQSRLATHKLAHAKRSISVRM